MTATTSRPAIVDSMPIRCMLGGDQLTDRHCPGDTQGHPAVGDQHASSQSHHGAQPRFAAGVQPAVPDRTATPATTPEGLTLFDPALALAADVLDDLERVRTANANRLRQLTRSTEDSDGEQRGFGLDESHPDVARLAAIVDTLAKVEHDATLQLQRQMRRHPLAAWAKAQRGVGEKQVARLLATIGDPYINSNTGLPRTVSALWAYCGLHVLPAASQRLPDTHHAGAGGGGQDIPSARVSPEPESGAPGGGDRGDPGRDGTDAPSGGAGVAPRRRRGQLANWSTNAKTRAYLIATSCLKQLVKPCTAGETDGHWRADHVDGCACSTYRVTYDQRRMHTATTHPEWEPGHSHNDALRVASKAILRDLWRAARNLHCGPEVTP